MTALRVVLDTNVLVSGLIFRSGPAAQIREAWIAERCVPLLSKDTASELVAVLSYPKFKLSLAEQEELLADILPYGEIVRIPRRLTDLPYCRDPSDAMFLQLAVAGKAALLVTGDRDLLELRPVFKVPILSPTEALRAIAASIR